MAISRDSLGGGRKDEHVRLAEELRELRDAGAVRDATAVRGVSPHGVWDDVRFMHHSFPGGSFDGVALETSVCGRDWAVPFYINAMTGGSEKTALINADLARAAAATGVAMATGSASPALKDPSLAHSFAVVRENAPDAFLFANVSPEMTVEQARDAVGFLDADALQVHVNPAQELVMPEGDRDFSGWLDRLADIVAGVGVPVVVKEVAPVCRGSRGARCAHHRRQWSGRDELHRHREPASGEAGVRLPLRLGSVCRGVPAGSAGVAGDGSS